MQDGQEDPGAVETSGMGVELALAEEFRHVAEGLPVQGLTIAAKMQGQAGRRRCGGAAAPRTCPPNRGTSACRINLGRCGGRVGDLTKESCQTVSLNQP
jgi:hypothetical protein